MDELFALRRVIRNQQCRIGHDHKNASNCRLCALLDVDITSAVAMRALLPAEVLVQLEAELKSCDGS